MEKLESALGLSFLDLPEQRISATITNVVLWAAVGWKEPQMTREQVTAWIDEADYATCMEKAIEVYGLALETFATNPQRAAPIGGTGMPPDVPPLVSG